MVRHLAVLAILAAASPARADDDPAHVLAALPADLPRCDAARAHCFGLQLHVPIVDGALVVTPAWLAEQVAEAQRHFAAIDVGFEVVGAEPLPEAAAHLVTREDRSGLAKAGLPNRVIHVYLTGKLEDVDHPGDPVYGVTWRRGDRKYVIVSAEAFPRTLAHELGHVFGLPHSEYAISIMNKTPRAEPPLAERTFAPQELAAMRPAVTALIAGGVLKDRAAKPPRR